MNLLMVSSYPPMACGIGAYAEQEVRALRESGATVNIFAPPDGDGDFQGNLLGGFSPLRLARYLWAYDEARVQFTPHFFYESNSSLSRLCTSLAFLILAALYRRKLKFVIHETEYRVDDPAPKRAARVWLDRWMWRLCGGVTFHSDRERAAFLRYYQLSANPKFTVTAHDRHFRRRCELDRVTARIKLGVDEESLLLLCIGFIQPHKGFDRVIEAMRHVPSPNLALRIVGSVRIAWEPALEYARLLHEMVRADPRCSFIETYLDDERFDMWIAASDYVVVPYHEIWSSGVAARAKLYNRPVIVSDAGGLIEQMTPGSHKFRNDAELAEVLSRLAPGGRDTSDDQVLTVDHPAFTRGLGWSELIESVGPSGQLQRHRWTVGQRQTLDWTGPAEPGDYKLRVHFWRTHPYPSAEMEIEYLLPGETDWKSMPAPLEEIVLRETIHVERAFQKLHLEFRVPTWIPRERIAGSADPRELGVMLLRVEVLKMKSDSDFEMEKRV